MSPHRLAYTIADVTFVLETPDLIRVLPSFQPFLTETGHVRYTARFRLTGALPALSAAPLEAAPEYQAVPDGKGGFLRRYRDPRRDNAPYAITTWDFSRRRIDVALLPWGQEFIGETGNSLFHLGLETVLLHEDRIILHAACLNTPYGGLLFSGPSGVGKSTQAALWETHTGARQINGDRPVLAKGGDGWRAYGSPYAGSSRCHINESCPVRAVILLRQAPENTLCRLKPAKAFSGVFQGVTVNAWNPADVCQAAELTEALIRDVPVYVLSCRPDDGAVEILRRELEVNARGPSSGK